jgi:hypothetical protein
MTVNFRNNSGLFPDLVKAFKYNLCRPKQFGTSTVNSIIPDHERLTMIKRRVEIIAFERQRMVIRPALMNCPVCRINTELLTTRQAGALAQVKAQSIRRWIASGKAHGVKTPGGHHRICSSSLFLVTYSSSS